jgi:hypothetical protein
LSNVKGVGDGVTVALNATAACVAASNDGPFAKFAESIGNVPVR